MSFTAANLDSKAAVARADGQTIYPTGKCLQFVDQMFQKPPSDHQVLGGVPYSTAKLAADYVPTTRRYSLADAHVGMVAFFSNGSAPGHIAIINGVSTVQSTDKHSGGHVATVTIDEIIHSWGGRPFRFATDWLMGHNIVNLGARLGGAPAPAPAAAPAPAGHAAGNPFGISDVRGLQKIAKLNGGNTNPDNIWGAESAKGFAQFLRAAYGYSGDNTLGPVMWAAIARWLRKRWGYVGNDTPGPIMRAHLETASEKNFAQL
jgi:hypothetical protein